MQQNKFITVTGFGPFVGHEDVNASWEAVRLLPDKISFENCEFEIRKMEIPVEYAKVDAAVQEIWSQDPMLVIHCGVHGAAKCLHLEKTAYNHQFRRPDYSGMYLQNNSACLDCTNDVKKEQRDILSCRFDLYKLSEVIQRSCKCLISANVDLTTADNSSSTVDELTTQSDNIVNENIDTQDVCRVSYDIGNYLCGYIYLKSLDYNNLRTLFVHVPPIDERFSPENTKNILIKILDECLRQLVYDLCDCK